MSTSVVLVTYRRLARLEDIVRAWLAESSDVWLCDCSAGGAGINVPGLKLARFSPDPGNRTRHAVALLTSGDLVIKADDDVMPRPGLVADFECHMAKLGPAILGIHGRRFYGPDYYRDTRHFGSKELEAPLEVQFVGVVTCSPREYLPMDLRDCATEVEDLYWQMACYPNVRKFVIKTDRFVHLAESKDDGRLCANPRARRTRESFYHRYYQKYFSG